MAEENKFQKFDPERVSGYITHDEINKVVNMDVELMGVDLVTMCKASGMTKEVFTTMMSEIFDDTEIQIRQDIRKMS